MDEYGVVRRCKILMRTTNLRGARMWRDRAFLSSRGRVRSLFFLTSPRACVVSCVPPSCLYIELHRSKSVENACDFEHILEYLYLNVKVPDATHDVNRISTAVYIE
jgi:hypothetical protein